MKVKRREIFAFKSAMTCYPSVGIGPWGAIQLQSQGRGSSGRHDIHYNLSIRTKRVADCQFILYDLSILEVFGIQSFASSEQRRGHNRRVIK
jgi:hypothetical protein